MARINTEKITLGLGVLELGVFSNGAFVSYADAGAIKATGTVTWMRETLPFETGRPLQIVKRDTVREHAMFQFELAEVSVANIKASIGYFSVSSSVVPTFVDGTSVAPTGDLTSSVSAVGPSDVIGFGGLCDLNLVSLRFTHLKACSTGRRQIVEIYKARPTGTLALPFRETDWNQYTIQWEAEPDLTKPAGQQLMQFIDERP